ncbi:AAA family ATPase [Nitratidesulfovibrio vulgaris]|uniref:YhaN AAA domain-containing protein n=1 Tax=Nitratidesulfovibrio vulgaris (strain DP4) TaxID=391774 RepID=A0A0H3AB78_NITV4|nr:AAA family ATPase [Nitratidesulfovibrio vulgaris]ABM29903.1 conserved hypothetical protein [Nitratidesulfovibrio vulgaris DP4]GEB81365.1 hypothetical protein DDE01_27800 [Desulfovibrio desulfuricans]
MRIVNGHIDGFGILPPQALPDLTPGLSVFLGRNEAGKSTCLDFFRAMLAGYPDGRSREGKQRSGAPLNGGAGGGSLLLETGLAGRVRLTRKPGGNGGQLSLADAEGAPLDAMLAERLFAGVTREVYRNVYGFSLDELQSFQSLNAEGVRNALYGASFGMGVRPPGEALKQLDGQLADLFKNGGQKPVINQLLARLKQVRDTLRNHESDAATYQRTAERLALLETELADLRQRRSSIEDDTARLARRITAWQHWEESVRLEGQLDALSPVVTAFPADGVRRLEELLERSEERALTETNLRTRQQRLDEALEGLRPDTALLAVLPDIDTLTERKASCRNAMGALPGLAADLAHAREMLATRLAALGPDWTVERARALDRSLFARERIAGHEKALLDAASDEQRAADELARCQREHDSTAQDVALAQTALDAMPAAKVTPLSPEAAERLATRLDRAAGALGDLPQARHALSSAREATRDALKGLLPAAFTTPHHDGDAADATAMASGTTDGAVDRPDAQVTQGAALGAAPGATQLAAWLLNAREDLLTLDHAVSTSRDAAEAARREAVQTTTDLATARERLGEAQRRAIAAHDALTCEVFGNAPPHHGSAGATGDATGDALPGGLTHGNAHDVSGRMTSNVGNSAQDTSGLRTSGQRASRLADITPLASAIETRAAALRRLSRVAADLRTERNTLDGIEERLAAHNAATPAGRGNSTLAGLGAALCVCGVGLLATLLPAVAALPATASLLALLGGITVASPLGTALAVAGLGVTAATWPRKAPGLAAHTAETTRLAARRDTLHTTCARLTDEVGVLTAQVGAEGADDAALERAAARIERWRDALATLRRHLEECETCSSETNRVAMRDDTARQHAEEATRHHAKACAALEAALAAIAPGLQLQAVPPLMERAATLRALTDREADAARTVAALEAHVAALATEAATVPDLATLSLPEGAALAEMVRSYLAAQRDAARLWQERRQAEAALATARQRLERCRAAQTAAEKVLREAAHRTASTQDAWRDLLAAQGLDASLTPATARDALSIAEECITLDDRGQRLLADIRQRETERDALVVPLAALCARLGRTPGTLTAALAAGEGGTAGQHAPASLPTAARPSETDMGTAIDWLATLDALSRAAHEAHAQQERRDRLLNERAVLVEELESATTALTTTRAAIEALLAEGAARDTETFRHRAAAWETRNDLQRQLAERHNALAVAAGDEPLEALRTALAATDLATLEEDIATLRAEREHLRARESESMDEAATLRASMNALATADTLAALRRQEASLLETIRQNGLVWARHALARHFLVNAKRRFEQERQPQVIRDASAIFATITDGAWTGIAASLEDNSLHVTPPHGEAIAPEALSRGTQEQLYLALRLAYIRSHAAHAEPLPVVMDDILVNFDPARAARTARALATLARGDATGPGHQILFFTCHPHTVSLLLDTVPEAQSFTVESGRMAPA